MQKSYSGIFDYILYTKVVFIFILSLDKWYNCLCMLHAMPTTNSSNMKIIFTNNCYIYIYIVYAFFVYVFNFFCV